MVFKPRSRLIRGSFCALIIALLTMANSVSAASNFFSALLSQVQSLRAGVQGEPSEEQPPVAGLDFSEVDGAFQAFLDDSAVFDGISYVVVDANATLHTATFGDHTEDLVVMLASTSKVPAVMTLLALDEDSNVSFSVDQPVSTMLPYEGVYTDRTIVQMVSNTTGIPGLSALNSYGNPFGQTLEDLNHLCTFVASDFVEFEACGEQLLTNQLAASQPAGNSFDYGGSQWQAAGVTASVAANTTWNQLVDQYLGAPCGLEVFTFGNPWQELNFGDTSFNGTVESLPGQSNPHIGGGAITNLADYAKLLQVHLNGGFCGDQQVLTQTALDRMRVDRGGVVSINPTPYGMGWWISSDNPGVYDDPGAFGAISFIDVERGIGGYIAIDDYSRDDSNAPVILVRKTIIPLIQALIDSP